MPLWQNATVTICHLDKMPLWQNADLTKCHLDQMTWLHFFLNRFQRSRQKMKALLSCNDKTFYNRNLLFCFLLDERNYYITFTSVIQQWIKLECLSLSVTFTKKTNNMEDLIKNKRGPRHSAWWHLTQNTQPNGIIYDTQQKWHSAITTTLPLCWVSQMIYNSKTTTVNLISAS